MEDPSRLENEIANNLENVQNRIVKAANSAGRNANEILLVVVSKKQPINFIQTAVNAGIRNFGENYPEQAIEKIAALSTYTDIQWHMIGHLQSRKVKLVAQNFNWMHSIDSLTLAIKLNEILKEENRILPVLLQYNVGGESVKHGWDASNETKWVELLPDIDKILKLSHLDIRGMMTMPPFETKFEMARKHFSKLYRFREYIRNIFPDNSWKDLSMGTSGDFEAAILEGATMIRIGQAILGSRA